MTRTQQAQQMRHDHEQMKARRRARLARKQRDRRRVAR